MKNNISPDPSGIGIQTIFFRTHASACISAHRGLAKIFSAGGVMKSIRKEIVTIMILCTLLSIVMVGLLSIQTTRQITNKNSVQQLSLLSDSSKQEINAVIDSIEQSVRILEIHPQ